MKVELKYANDEHIMSGDLMSESFTHLCIIYWCKKVIVFYEYGQVLVSMGKNY